MSLDLDQIRERDAAWKPHCSVCDMSATANQHDPIEPECIAPEDHHEYMPATKPDWDDAAEFDRRALIAEVERLRAALRTVIESGNDLAAIEAAEAALGAT